jgi:threonine dehydrogenase-like Zn-dependent dehydrogenase
VGINASVLVSKELTLKSVNYAAFEEALKWLIQHQQHIEPLLGESFNLENWEAAFSKAEAAESKKIFIRVGG